MDTQLETVGPEGIRLDGVAARRDVLRVHRLHELGLVQVEHVEAGVERDAARVEERTHRAVAEERALGQAGEEGRGHDLYAPSPCPLPRGERVEARRSRAASRGRGEAYSAML